MDRHLPSYGASGIDPAHILNSPFLSPIYGSLERDIGETSVGQTLSEEICTLYYLQGRISNAFRIRIRSGLLPNQEGKDRPAWLRFRQLNRTKVFLCYFANHGKS
jgi:hypothetical protein